MAAVVYAVQSRFDFAGNLVTINGNDNGFVIELLYFAKIKYERMAHVRSGGT